MASAWASIVNIGNTRLRRFLDLWDYRPLVEPLLVDSTSGRNDSCCCRHLRLSDKCLRCQKDAGLRVTDGSQWTCRTADTHTIYLSLEPEGIHVLEGVPRWASLRDDTNLQNLDWGIFRLTGGLGCIRNLTTHHRDPTYDFDIEGLRIIYGSPLSPDEAIEIQYVLRDKATEDRLLLAKGPCINYPLPLGAIVTGAFEAPWLASRLWIRVYPTRKNFPHRCPQVLFWRTAEMVSNTID